MSFPSDTDDSKSTSMPKSELGSRDETILGQQLKMQFHSIRKGDGESIESYVKNLKSTADSLTAIGNPISDQDLVVQLLAGLPSQYSPYRNTISSKFPLPDFSGACSLLYMYEALLQEQKANPTTSTSPSEEENYNYNNNNKERFDKLLDVFSTVTSVATTAWDLWSVFRNSSSSTTTTVAGKGNKKYTGRRSSNGGRRNYNRGGPSGRK